MAPPSKRPKRAKMNLSVPRVLSHNSPILNQDIHGFITTALSPVQWQQYTEEEKRKIIDLFPVACRRYHQDATGSLVCPVNIDFLQHDAYIKTGVARFKRDLENGCWEEKWQRDARKAMRERKEGKFDEYLKEHAQEQFGEEAAAENVGQADGDDIDSDSDWGRENGRKNTDDEYVVEKLVGRNENASKIEVK